MRSSTDTLVKALRILARDIQSEDGVANAAIAEAADRLEELERENAALRADKERLDFLGQTKCAYYYEGPCCWRINEDKLTDSRTLRAAIDAARKEAQS